MKGFQEYLYEQHAQVYKGLNEEMINDYFVWENSLTPVDWKYYAQDFALKYVDAFYKRVVASIDRDL
jgi:hypothetical protein